MPRGLRTYGRRTNVQQLSPRDQYRSISAFLVFVPFIAFSLFGASMVACPECRSAVQKVNWSWFSLDLVVAIATVMALLVAVWQMRLNAKISKEAYARDAWLRYLELGMQFPLYHSTLTALSAVQVETAEEMYNLGTEESERYFWFVEIMLEACERMLLFSSERYVEDTVKSNILMHWDALQTFWKAEQIYYSDNLQNMVAQVGFELQQS